MPIQVYRVKGIRYSIIRCVSKHITAVLLPYCRPGPPPRFMHVQVCIEFSVHGTISSLVVYMHRHYIYSKSQDQLGKIANSARGQLIREDGYFPVLVCA